MSTENLSPETRLAENELICEKLLGWRRLTHSGVTWWEPPSTGKFQPTMLAALSFESWAEAGLILDALVAKKAYPVVGRCATVWTCTAYAKAHMFEQAGCDESGPLAVRAAALEYLKAVRT